MFTIYNIEDFSSAKCIKGQFILERFEQLKRPENLQWPHKHSFYEILWLTSGTSVNIVDYHQTNIEPNTLFFISPGQLHLMSTTKNVRGYSIVFTEEFLMLTANSKDRLMALSFFDNSTSYPYLKLDKTSRNELTTVINMLELEVKTENKSAVIISHLLFVLLNKIQRIIDTKQKYYDHSNVMRFKQFRKLIEQHFKEQKKLPFYAEQLALTPHRINQICRQVSGKTAGELIKERVLLETKRLLVHSDWQIGEISDYLGFEDISYFSRQFKEKEFLTPLAFRKEMSQKHQNL